MSFIVIEEESGHFRVTRAHPHNGYWAGRLTEPAEPAVLARWFEWGHAQPVTNFSSRTCERTGGR